MIGWGLSVGKGTENTGEGGGGCWKKHRYHQFTSIFELKWVNDCLYFRPPTEPFNINLKRMNGYWILDTQAHSTEQNLEHRTEAGQANDYNKKHLNTDQRGNNLKQWENKWYSQRK